MRILIPALLLLLLSAGCQSAPETKKIAIVGARLVDGKAVIEHSIVLIEGATIIKAGSQTSVPLPKDVEIVDGMGKTIEPTSNPINPGQPASLKLDQRIMKDGQWQN